MHSAPNTTNSSRAISNAPPCTIFWSKGLRLSGIAYTDAGRQKERRWAHQLRNISGKKKKVPVGKERWNPPPRPSYPHNENPAPPYLSRTIIRFFRLYARLATHHHHPHPLPPPPLVDATRSPVSRVNSCAAVLSNVLAARMCGSGALPVLRSRPVVVVVVVDDAGRRWRWRRSSRRRASSHDGVRVGRALESVAPVVARGQRGEVFRQYRGGARAPLWRGGGKELRCGKNVNAARCGGGRAGRGNLVALKNLALGWITCRRPPLGGRTHTDSARRRVFFTRAQIRKKFSRRGLPGGRGVTAQYEPCERDGGDSCARPRVLTSAMRPPCRTRWDLRAILAQSCPLCVVVHLRAGLSVELLVFLARRRPGWYLRPCRSG